ncbi:hypothetical protein BDV06DRAFT_221849 [Aspergillus oleicola]
MSLPPTFYQQVYRGKEASHDKEDAEDSDETKQLLQSSSDSSPSSPAQDKFPAIDEKFPGPLNILLAESNRHERFNLVAELERRGHYVVAYDNGQDCVYSHRAALNTSRCSDVIFMGPNLDQIDCTLAVPLIRASEHMFQLGKRGERRPVPIFAVSECLEDDERNALIRARIDGWIRRPLDKELLSVILASLRDKELRNRFVMEKDRWLTGLGGWFKQLG